MGELKCAECGASIDLDGDHWFSVTVNGSVLVGFGSAHKDVATERARDLRRALRKGGG